jgi:hypothetical protein
VRLLLGKVFGWDAPAAGGASSALRARLPAELRGPARDHTPGAGRFSPLYLLDDEWAMEFANRTMHGVVHLGWVADPDGGYRGQLAVLVKRNGLLGSAYMTAIKPFRYAIVYPLMSRALARAWRALPDERMHKRMHERAARQGVAAALRVRRRPKASEQADMRPWRRPGARGDDRN